MSDLISRDKIVQAVVKNPNMTASELYSMIIDAPIEFDVDKVVEQLKESDFFIDQEKCITVEDAIKIVKGGGQGEQD